MFKPKQYFSPAYATYDVRTPMRSAGPRPYDPDRYIPQQYATPMRDASGGGHGRRVTVDTADFHSSSPLPTYMRQPASHYHPPVRIQETRPKTSYASETDRLRAKAQRHSSSSKKQKFGVKVDHYADYYDNFSPYHSPQHTPPPAYYDTQYVAPPSYNKTRPRASTSTQKPSRQPSTKKARKVTSTPQIPVATVEDVRHWKLPAHVEKYSLKNWDPREEPVTLLGSVFDADSLGKWIYDWTVYHHGAGAPMSDEAGQLWLALIQLSAKRKQADSCLKRIANRSKKHLVLEHLEESDDIWRDLLRLLQTCEKYMYRQAKKVSTTRGTKTEYGSNSGCEFVDSIFGRDRELETTQTLINDIRCWTRDFEDNCEEILRRPRD